MSRFQRDMGERLLRTALQAAIGVLCVELASPNFQVSQMQAIAVTAVAAAASAVMSALGHYVGNPDSGSWEP